MKASYSFGFVVLILLTVVSLGSHAAGQRQIDSIKGADLYKAYCASCHGEGAKGDGPRAATLTVPPPDLTLMAKRNGGKFNRTRVQDIIAGDARPGRITTNPATGRPALRVGDSFDPMPVWGSSSAGSGRISRLSSARGPWPATWRRCRRSERRRAAVPVRRPAAGAAT